MAQLYKITLNPWNTQAQRDLAQPYEMHRTLSKALHGIGTEGRMLYRVETEGQAAHVLLQTETPATGLEKTLPTGYANCTDGPKTLDTALAAMENGRAYRFRLLANPTVKLKKEGAGNSARVPLVRAESTDSTHGYMQWLQRKGEMHGFALMQVTDSPQRLNSLIKGKKVPLMAVCFDGMLTVTDAELLRKAVLSGIGSGKAFGFGLLSLGPA